MNFVPINERRTVRYFREAGRIIHGVGRAIKRTPLGCIQLSGVSEDPERCDDRSGFVWIINTERVTP